MVKGMLQYDGPVDLSQYFVREMELIETGYSVRVDIVFSRRIFSTMLTTYLPTALICIVCFATNYFKAFFFEATVTVNLTCLLVLTTLFIGVSNTLPATAYVKLIDVWMLMTLTVPLFEVLLHTYIDAHR